MITPSKMHSSLADAKGYGFDVEVRSFDFGALKKARDEYVKRLNGIYQGNVERANITLVLSVFNSFNLSPLSKSCIRFEGGQNLLKDILIPLLSMVPSIPASTS
jgi:hypothetical protein